MELAPGWRLDHTHSGFRSLYGWLLFEGTQQGILLILSARGQLPLPILDGTMTSSDLVTMEPSSRL